MARLLDVTLPGSDDVPVLVSWNEVGFGVVVVVRCASNNIETPNGSFTFSESNSTVIEHVHFK